MTQKYFTFTIVVVVTFCIVIMLQSSTIFGKNRAKHLYNTIQNAAIDDETVNLKATGFLTTNDNERKIAIQENEEHCLEKKPDFVREKTNKRAPTFISAVLPAVDLISNAERSPVMFNIIRSPIIHQISIYKGNKYGSRGTRDVKKQGPFFPECGLSFEDYFLQYGLSGVCLAGHGMRMGLTLLCGECPKCTREDCLARAKKNVESLYLTIGLSEHIPEFIQVMETLLPQFFHGVLKTYVRRPGLYTIFSNDTEREEPMSEKTMQLLEKALTPDIELYAFVKERFYVALKKVVEYIARL